MLRKNRKKKRYLSFLPFTDWRNPTILVCNNHKPTIDLFFKSKPLSFQGTSITETGLRIHWRLSMIFKTSYKVFEVIFFICKSMYILKVYSIHYALRYNTNVKKKLQNGNKTIKFKKTSNHTKYEQPNVPSYLHIFWLNFDKVLISFVWGGGHE